MRKCPFPECAASRIDMTMGTLERHLASVHVNSGLAIPTETLNALGRYVCLSCHHLVTARAPCPHCQGPEPQPPQAGTDIEQGVVQPPRDPTL